GRRPGAVRDRAPAGHRRLGGGGRAGGRPAGRRGAGLGRGRHAALGHERRGGPRDPRAGPDLGALRPDRAVPQRHHHGDAPQRRRAHAVRRRAEPDAARRHRLHDRDRARERRGAARDEPRAAARRARARRVDRGGGARRARRVAADVPGLPAIDRRRDREPDPRAAGGRDRRGAGRAGARRHERVVRRRRRQRRVRRAGNLGGALRAARCAIAVVLALAAGVAAAEEARRPASGGAAQTAPAPAPAGAAAAQEAPGRAMGGGAEAAARAPAPASGGAPLLRAAAGARRVLAGTIEAPAALDRSGWAAWLRVDRELPAAEARGPATAAGERVRIAWEELVPSRPPRFRDGERVLVALEPLPGWSLWRQRLPRRDALAVAEQGQAFLREPNPATIEALARWRALAAGERDGPAGADALAELVARAAAPLAEAATAELAALPGLPTRLGDGGVQALADALA